MKLFVAASLTMLIALGQGSGPYASQQPAEGSADGQAARHSRSNPWRGLFHAAPVETASTVQSLTGPSDRTAVVIPRARHEVQRGPCNMPVIAADHGVDPQMVIPHPAGVDAKIRVIEPPVCGHTSLSGAEFVEAVPTRNTIGSHTIERIRKP